jgi:diguanylate cyclase (GGDEF)-like protein/PAS domain S-box-containing protein
MKAAPLDGTRGRPLAALALGALLVRVLCRRQIERERAEALIGTTERQFREITNHSMAAIYICDRESRYLMANPAYAGIVGWEPEEIVGRHRRDVVPPELLQRIVASDARALAGETVTEELTDARGQVTSGLKFALTDENGAVYALCGIVTDVTEIRQMRHEIAHLAAFDPLTGLFNRGRLLEALDAALRHRPGRLSGGALLRLDIDNFRAINDSLGHEAGDAYLRAVAGILRQRMRDTDLVARLHGDEFVVVLWGDDEAGALKVADEVRALLAERLEGAIHLSVGVSTFVDGDETTAEDLLVAADVALREAQEAGGDRSCAYRWRSASGLAWVRRIRAALDEGSFELHAQPIFDLHTNRIVMHELLIRMRSDDGDLIPPAAFIPAAEQLGLIGEIDHWVLDCALELAGAGHPVAVNLSAHSLNDERLLAAVRRAVEDGLDPRKVVFEITETAAIGNIPQARQLAATLAEIGCSLALDDFGTGFGSFSYLKHLPAGYIKIDMDFVRQIVTNPTDRQIVSSIAGIAAALGKLTIAEGVEDEATLEAVRELGIDYVQGYHIGRPQPLDQALGAVADPAGA